jgi:Domain of unknown function DUF29
LYDRDFLLWTEEQAAALRRAKASNLPLDWENLAEEIDSLGKSVRRELSSQIRRILRHLFKLASSPASAPRLGWQATVKAARDDVGQLLDESPSLRREVDALVTKQLPIAVELAAGDLVRHGEAADVVGARLAQGGFSTEQVLEDWLPDPPAPPPGPPLHAGEG